jgi:curli biogenesis system outer membrane secretion channel CsgG
MPSSHTQLLPRRTAICWALLASCPVLAQNDATATNPAIPVIPTMPAMPAATPAPAPTGGTPQQESKSKRHADRPSVTIREFRSSVAEITPRAATDMFMTALVEAGKFRVLERARLAEGVMAERGLNQAGLVSGQSADIKLVSAKYVFEGTVSEAQMDQNSTSAGLNIMGIGAKRTTTRDTIGIDVRVIEVESGVVADAIKVRRQIKGKATEAGGIGDAATNAISNRFLGGAVHASGGKEYESRSKESLDNALRLAIEEAIEKIAKRFADE